MCARISWAMLFLCVVPVLASAQSIGAAEFPAASLAGNEFLKAVEPDWWLDNEEDRQHALAHVGEQPLLSGRSNTSSIAYRKIGRLSSSQARKKTFMEGWIKKLFPGDGVIVGWVFDRENPTRTVTVNFYVDGIAMDTPGVGGYDASGALAGSIQAQAINKQVNWTYNIDGNHGFSFRIPDKWRDGAAHSLYVQPVTFDGAVSPPIGAKNGYPFILPAATTVYSPPVVDAHCLEADSRCPSVGSDYLAPNYATAMGWSDGKNYFNEWGCTSPIGMDTIARLNIIPLGTYGPHFQKDSLDADWYQGTSDGRMSIVYFDLARIDHGSRWSMKKAVYNKANNKWEIYSVLDNPESDGGVSSRDGRGRYIVMNDYSLPGWGPSSPIPGSENKIPGVSDVSANTDIPSYPLVGTGPLGITAMTNTLYQPTTRGTNVMGKTCIHMNPKLLDYDAQDRPQTLIVNLWHDTKSEACPLPPGAPIQRLPYPGNYLYRFRGPELGWQLDLAAGLVTDSLYNITSNRPSRTPTLVAGTAHTLVTANSDGVVYTIDLAKPKANNASVLLDCRAGKKAIFGQATAAQDGRVLFKGEKSDIAVERKTYGLGNDVFPAEIYYAFRRGDDRNGSEK